MLSLDWPWVFLLTPLPLLVRWLSRPAESLGSALRVPFFQQLQRLQQVDSHAFPRTAWRGLLLALIWLALLLAAARPTWTGEPIPLPQEGRDLMLAVDISQSMAEPDMEVNGSFASRIDAVKYVLSEFIERRTGDRIGLILFGERSYLQTPLTFDRNSVQIQLIEAQLGFAGYATAIGDAIGLGVKRLRDREAGSRVLILLTDGANTAGSNPREAAAIAAEAGVRIHTIGIGAEARMVTDLFGQRRAVNPSADLDEDSLQYIADTTGGEYFRARDPAELALVYQAIDQLEPVPEDVTYRPQRSLFHWPLGVALLLSWLLTGLGLIPASAAERVA